MRQRFQQVQHDQTMTNSSNSSRRDWRDMFAVPPIIKQVFAQFPLSTYTANALPTRSPTHRDQHTLYTWTSTQDARTNNPSFNPTCLKWQTYLLFNDMPFRAQPSNNHASPSGSLPFLLPANSSIPLASAKLESWTTSQSTSKSSSGTQSSRQEEEHGYTSSTSSPTTSPTSLRGYTSLPRLQTLLLLWLSPTNYGMQLHKR
jgi:hypothetical protein